MEQKRVLGHTFVPMTEEDWDAYAGCDEGTLICSDLDDVVLLLNPDGTVTVIDGEQEEVTWAIRSC